ncbi:MAG: baseplate J/gp47 family protein, partial [Fusobacteriaceae bacterium]
MELTNSGYKIKSYEEILKEINDDIKLQIPNLSLDDSNPIIKTNKKMADLLHKMSQLGSMVYSSQSVDQAMGKALEDRVFSLLGLIRYSVQKASGFIEIQGTPDTIVKSFFQVSTENNKVFRTLNDVTLNKDGIGVASIQALEGGVFCNVEAETITKIVNPLFGVDSVINRDITIGGSDTESDTQLRLRYFQQLSGLGRSTIPSIVNTVLLNSEATKINIIENDTDVDGYNGLPPHSFEAVILGGESESLLNLIYENRPLGI